MTSELIEVTAAIPPDEFAVILASAERELAAFYTAVNATYGPEQAELSALDWLTEMERAGWSARDHSFKWRTFTYLAAAKLAERVCPNELSTEGLRAAHP